MTTSKLLNLFCVSIFLFSIKVSLNKLHIILLYKYKQRPRRQIIYLEFNNNKLLVVTLLILI